MARSNAQNPKRRVAPRIARTVRFDNDILDKEVAFYADQLGVTRNEFMVTAIRRYVDQIRTNTVRDDVLTQRISELTDAVMSQTATVDLMQRDFSSTMQAFLRLMYGDSVLLDYDDHDGDLLGTGEFESE